MSAKPSRTPSSAWTVTSATPCSSFDDALPSDADNVLSLTLRACAGVMKPLATSDCRSVACKVSAAVATPRAISSIVYHPSLPCRDSLPLIAKPSEPLTRLHRGRTRHAGRARRADDLGWLGSWPKHSRQELTWRMQVEWCQAC